MMALESNVFKPHISAMNYVHWNTRKTRSIRLVCLGSNLLSMTMVQSASLWANIKGKCSIQSNEPYYSAAQTPIYLLFD